MQPAVVPERCAFIRILAFAVCLVPMIGAAGVASAQAQSREVHIGTFGGRGQSVGESATRTQSRDADRLLAEARDDLAAGYIQAGRRQLELLLQRYPDTAAAQQASQVLSRLPREAAEQERSERSPLPQRSERQATRVVRAETVATERQRLEWSNEIRRAQFMHDFRMAVGDRVFFGAGGSDLGARARQVLAAQAAWLKRHPDLGITVEGHADDGAPSRLNDEIANQRAQAVKLRLIEEGVAAERIAVVSLGRDKPVARCEDPACSAQNRRVVTVIAPQRAASVLDPASRSGLGMGRRE